MRFLLSRAAFAAGVALLAALVRPAAAAEIHVVVSGGLSAAVHELAPQFEQQSGHKLTIDQGFSYTYYDRRQLSLTGFLALDAIFLGNINLDQTKASQYQYDVDVRYGLTDRISVDLDLPYMYRTSEFISGGAGGASASRPPERATSCA